MLIFWLGLVIYGSFKLRTYILIDRDQVLPALIVTSYIIEWINDHDATLLDRLE